MRTLTSSGEEEKREETILVHASTYAFNLTYAEHGEARSQCNKPRNDQEAFHSEREMP